MPGLEINLIWIHNTDYPHNFYVKLPHLGNISIQVKLLDEGIGELLGHNDVQQWIPECSFTYIILVCTVYVLYSRTVNSKQVQLEPTHFRTAPVPGF